jgi:ankyrin repeat protein
MHDDGRGLAGSARRRVLRSALLACLLPAVGACGSAHGSDADAATVFSDARTAALAQAALNGDSQSVRRLIAQGASLSARGADGITLLEWALLRRSKLALNTLLEAGADPSQPGTDGDTVLHLAAKAGDPTYLALLLDHGADPDAPNGITQAPPLDAALMNTTDDAFDLLLAHHADPNRPDRMGDTPLHVAAQVHKTECVMRLLEAGADPTRRNHRGDTFQVYFAITPAGGLSSAGKARRDAVYAWLRAHHVPVEGS